MSSGSDEEEVTRRRPTSRRTVRPAVEDDDDDDDDDDDGDNLFDGNDEEANDEDYDAGDDAVVHVSFSAKSLQKALVCISTRTLVRILKFTFFSRGESNACRLTCCFFCVLSIVSSLFLWVLVRFDWVET